jgi:hypothetical protein
MSDVKNSHYWVVGSITLIPNGMDFYLPRRNRLKMSQSGPLILDYLYLINLKLLVLISNID